MQTQVFKADKRGTADYGWLKANYSFSFANYYNPENLHFGVLRVLNDDVIEPSKGFDTHPHDNMEIITIPLSGRLAHKDSMGHTSYIESGEVQVMSAGKGIFHSEFNGSDQEDLNLFQIWLYPNAKDVEPRYQQISLESVAKKNELYQILSPNENDAGVWIHQDAWFSMGQIDAQWAGSYKVKKEGNGIYIMLIEGEVQIDGQILKQRDAIGIRDASSIEISANASSRLLIMDVPMK
ncbi:pirin family protein [Carboxylicivirga sp. M1479]|uniref:pirin family protein n=1 Tax=Carboxylicivirga sp. M1479 TaxID=2594476 RepID=UPI001177C759|nr:pirin family protein [Carboxylicivirga sp. M1479]TRX66223.1 pirin family protein [Carboxylicivirga sp. M1479]